MEKELVKMAVKMGKAYEDMAKRMAIKIRVAKSLAATYEKPENCPMFSEWKGMEQALYALGIDYYYEFGEDLEITAVVVEGHKAEL